MIPSNQIKQIGQYINYKDQVKIVSSINPRYLCMNVSEIIGKDNYEINACENQSDFKIICFKSFFKESKTNDDYEEEKSQHDNEIQSDKCDIRNLSPDLEKSYYIFSGDVISLYNLGQNFKFEIKKHLDVTDFLKPILINTQLDDLSQTLSEIRIPNDLKDMFKIRYNRKNKENNSNYWEIKKEQCLNTITQNTLIKFVQNIFQQAFIYVLKKNKQSLHDGLKPGCLFKLYKTTQKIKNQKDIAKFDKNKYISKNDKILISPDGYDGFILNFEEEQVTNLNQNDIQQAKMLSFLEPLVKEIYQILETLVLNNPTNAAIIMSPKNFFFFFNEFLTSQKLVQNLGDKSALYLREENEAALQHWFGYLRNITQENYD
ncbi:hypothetical protein PPERSA_09443 [Pseudocohnilembus persalinus]|uniref:Uncharacterized protein n=1 Tax=Pseudocohnilembus persalinus TaxID=266149 RepID=A0A0V0Q9M2_PSEPJ|nr:hypothetical protein PPERSA_09443 [Pseudocohnilembus persalinus]|eukprot:KRW98918.1 hypothetical protein PPERSA_09443 [Pseudocohnilembus persalinus]